MTEAAKQLVAWWVGNQKEQFRRRVDGLAEVAEVFNATLEDEKAATKKVDDFLNNLLQDVGHPV